jgi:hypothetical protein
MRIGYRLILRDGMRNIFVKRLIVGCRHRLAMHN